MPQKHGLVSGGYALRPERKRAVEGEGYEEEEECDRRQDGAGCRADGPGEDWTDAEDVGGGTTADKIKSVRTAARG